MTSLIECQRACLEERNCLGVDWKKLASASTSDSRRCYFIYPESTRYGVQPASAYCCDHYRRTYCLSTAVPRPDGNVTTTTATSAWPQPYHPALQSLYLWLLLFSQWELDYVNKFLSMTSKVYWVHCWSFVITTFCIIRSISSSLYLGRIEQSGFAYGVVSCEMKYTICCNKINCSIYCNFIAHETIPLLSGQRTSCSSSCCSQHVSLSCRTEGIPCRIVKGKVKGSGYRLGGGVEGTNDYCIVYVNNSWRFVDPHWGSQFVISAVDNNDDWEMIRPDSPTGYWDILYHIISFTCLRFLAPHRHRQRKKTADKTVKKYSKTLNNKTRHRKVKESYKYQINAKRFHISK